MRKFAAAWLFALLILAPCQSFAKVFLSVDVAPPPLLAYEQPPLPGPGYLWTPGYWAYDDDGWFWVSGAWVLPPEPDLLWTPGYWEWNEYEGVYLWRAGYWAREVGFYGGVPYGYGYTGYGYYGGYWDHGVFWYNSYYCRHIDRRYIRHSYHRAVVGNKGWVNTSGYNGGPGRSRLKPTPAELESAKNRRFLATPTQLKQRNIAMTSKESRFAVNRGRPVVPTTSKPGDTTVKNAAGTKAPVPAPNAPQLASPRGDSSGKQRLVKPDEVRTLGAEKSGGRPDPRTNAATAATPLTEETPQSEPNASSGQRRRKRADDEEFRREPPSAPNGLFSQGRGERGDGQVFRREPPSESNASSSQGREQRAADQMFRRESQSESSASSSRGREQRSEPPRRQRDDDNRRWGR